MNDQIGGYIVAQGAIDYAKPLSLQADKDAKDRANWLKLEAARAEAQLKADIKQKGDPLKEILQFASTAGTAVSQFQAAQKQAEVAKKTRLEKERLKAGVELTKLGPRRLDIFQADLKEATNDLIFDGAKFERLIRARSALSLKGSKDYLSPEAVKKILALSGSSFIHTQNFFANDIMSNPNKLVNELPGLTGPEKEEWQERYESHEEDPHAQTLMIKDLAYSEFARLGFSEDYIALNLEQPLSKFLNTKGVLATAKIKEAFHSENTLKFDKKIDVAVASPDPNALINVLSEDLIIEGSDKRASDGLVTKLSRLRSTGNLTLAEVELIRRSKLPEELGFPAGKFGRDLFSEEQWNQITESGDEYDAKVVANLVTQLQKKASSLVANRETTTEAQLTAFRNLLQEHGLSHKQEFKQVLSMKLKVDQSTTDQLQREYDKDALNGFYGLDLEGVKLKYAGNTTLQNLAVEQFKKDDADLKAAGYVPDTMNRSITESSGLAWSPGANAMAQRTVAVAGHMERIRRSIYMKHINNNRNANNGIFSRDYTISTLAEDEAKGYWERNGGGVQNQKDTTTPKDPRIFVFDVETESFKNHNNFVKRVKVHTREARTKWSEEDKLEAKQSFEQLSASSRYSDGTLNQDKLLKKRILTTHTLEAILETGVNPEEAIYYSGRSALGLETIIASDIDHIIEAAKAGDTVAGYLVKRYDLKSGETVKTKEHLSTKALKKIIAARDDSDPKDPLRERYMRQLLRGIQLRGWSGLSPNEKKLFYAFLEDNPQWDPDVSDQVQTDEAKIAPTMYDSTTTKF